MCSGAVAPPRPAGRVPFRDWIDGLLAIDWRMLPACFPPYSTVYGYFREFFQLGIWTRIWAALSMDAREQAGKEASPTAAIVDSQSVKTTESGGIKGFDPGKKTMGRKRHLLTDTLGLPLVITVHSAGIQDRDGFALVVDKVKRRFPWRKIVFADGGYNAIQTECAAAKNKLRLEIVKRPRDAKGFHLLPRPLQGLLALSPSEIG